MGAFSQKSKSNPSTSSAFSPRRSEDFFGLQAKLNIGKSNDKYEVEADKTADQIISQKQNTASEPFFSPSPTIQKKSNDPRKKEETENVPQRKPLAESITPVVQLKTGKEEAIQNKEEEEIQAKEDEKELQKSAGTNANPTDNPNLESNLARSKGGGSLLAGTVRNEMESGFGADFSKVKIHNDSNAVQMNKELGAQAFASGNDIYFNEGKFNPNTTEGKHLLAHELTHTVQQGASTVQPKMIQKTETPTPTVAAPTPTNEYIDPNQKGKINTTSKIFTLPNLKVPSFKAGFGPSSRFVIAKGTQRSNTHIQPWEDAAMTGTGFTTRFTDYAASQNAPNLRFNGEQIFYLSLTGGGSGGGSNAGASGLIF